MHTIRVDGLCATCCVYASVKEYIYNIIFTIEVQSGSNMKLDEIGFIRLPVCCVFAPGEGLCKWDVCS